MVQIINILFDTPQTNAIKAIKNTKNIGNAVTDGIGILRVGFDELIKNPNIFVKCVLMRRICDHIASLTDHYAIDEYNHLYG